ARRMVTKLDIYRKFTNALAVAVIVSVGWICYETVTVFDILVRGKLAVNKKRMTVKRRNEWPSVEAINYMSSFFLSPNWYAYSGDGEDFDRDDTLTLIKPSPMKDVQTSADTKPLQGNNGLSIADVEEEKTE
ncbi:hypothetical protein Ancab_011918, partial [Ancistrocladus abbreviatus]